MLALPNSTLFCPEWNKRDDKNDDGAAEEKGEQIKGDEEKQDDGEDNQDDVKEERKRVQNDDSSSPPKKLRSSAEISIENSLLEGLPSSNVNEGNKLQKKMKKKEKDPPTKWEEREIKLLLQILKIAKVHDLLDNTGLGRKNVFKKVSKILNQRGNCDKTEKQCISK